VPDDDHQARWASRRDRRLDDERRHSLDVRPHDRITEDLLLPYLDRHCARGTQLTPRQRDVLSLVADGLTNGEIASRLDISPETVRTHLEDAYARLGVHMRTGAVAALRT